MNSKNVKNLLGAALFGFVFAGSVSAQTAPDATVDANGNLLIDGQTIAPPAGTVDANGDLTIGDTKITKPTATLEPDGSLKLADGTILPVPDAPGGTNEFMAWMNTGTGDGVVQYDNTLDPTVAQQWYSYYFKATFYDPAAPNAIYLREFGSFFHFEQTSGVGSPDGFWAYGFSFPGTEKTWTYLSYPNFKALADNNNVVEGWVYLAGTGHEKWYLLKEFDDVADTAARGTYLLPDGGGTPIRVTNQP